MSGWASAACQAIGVIGAFVAGFIGSEIGKQNTGGQTGVTSLEIQHPIFQIINSTNVRLDALADQHNTHKEEVRQFMLIGFVSLALVVALLIAVLILVICCIYKKKLPRSSDVERQKNTSIMELEKI